MKHFLSIAVLGTPMTIKKGLYNYKGISYIELETDDLRALADSVHSFTVGIDPEKQCEKGMEIAERCFRENKADVLVLGCTEIALMLKDGNFPKINTTDVFLDATLKHIMK